MKQSDLRTSYRSLIHWPERLWQSVAWTVIVCFTVNCLAPAVVAAKTLAHDAKRYSAPAKSEYDVASDALIALEDTLDRMNRRLNGQFEFAWQDTLAQKTHATPPAPVRRADLATLESSLASNRAQLDAQQPTIQAVFAQTQSDLKTHSATSAIQARAQAQAAQYAQLYAQLTTLLAAIPAAKTDADYKAAVAAATAFLHSHSSKPKRAKFDPKHLAFGPPKERARKALTDPAAIRAAIGLSSSGTTQAAPASIKATASATATTQSSSRAASTFALTRVPAKLPAPNKKSPAHRASHPQAAQTATLPPNLSPTEDVQITPAIIAKAQALNNNPLAIYQFVRNNVEYLPTYGSIEGSDYTLQTLRGNDIDQASLLIALLRAANIPAHYVYGTIRVPIAQVENWVGGVTDSNAALDLMGQGGIPTLGLTQGGVIQYAQIEHVWVEAQIGFAPSRGAVTTPGTTWVPLDPSFKQHAYAAPILTSDLFGNTQAIANEISSSGTTSADGGSATGFNFQPLTDGIGAFRQAIASKIKASTTHPTLLDLFGAKSIISENLSLLAGSLPYQQVTSAIRFDTLPDSLRVYAELQLSQGTPSADLGDTVFDYRASLIQLSQSSLMLSAKGSTTADQSAWDNMTGTDFPPYAIKADEDLTLDGTVVATAQGVSLGDDYTLAVNIKGAGIDKSAQFDITAGDAMEVGFDTGGVTPSAAQQLLDRNDFGTLEGNLFLMAKSYWLSYDLFSQALSRMQHTVDVRLPSVGIFAAPISITYSFGIPAKATYKSHEINIKLNQSAVTALDGSHASSVAYVDSVGVMGSFLEGFVPEKLFHKLMGAGSNTTRLFELANANSVPIHHITASNYASQIPLLSQPQDVLLDVANAVNAGEDVTIPRTPQTNHLWVGTGYIMRDPATGSADYRINGNLSGDSQTECGRSTEPVPVTYPAVSIISELLLSASPIYIDDNGDINTGGISIAVLALAAIVILTIATGGVGDAAAAAVGTVGRRAALGLAMMFGFDEAFAADEDDCSCTPRALGYHRGGNAFHNYCADVRPPNKITGTDWEVSGKAFDALTPDDTTLWEVKTGKYSTYPQYVKDVELPKFLNEFQDDAENAISCGKKFVFGVTDAGLAADMQKAASPPQDASIQLITCP